MGQALIRNLDDGLIASYRAAADRNGRSLEAEYREALRRGRPMTMQERDGVLSRLAAIRAMTPNVVQTPAEALVREDRDGDRAA